MTPENWLFNGIDQIFVEDFSNKFIRLDDALRAIAPEIPTNFSDNELVLLLTARKKIKSLPTVDAVEVVRCKDCRHAKEQDEDGVAWCNGWLQYVFGEHFCSYGEKRSL